MIRPITYLALLAMLCPIGAGAQQTGTACPIKPVPLSLTGGKAGDISILLSDGNALAGGAMAWDEAMRLRQANGETCTVDSQVDIITTPIFDAGGRVLYVTTYSGSNTTLFAVSAQNCAIMWQSAPFTKGPFLHGRSFSFSDAPSVIITPTCLPRP